MRRVLRVIKEKKHTYAAYAYLYVHRKCIRKLNTLRGIDSKPILVPPAAPAPRAAADPLADLAPAL